MKRFFDAFRKGNYSKNMGEGFAKGGQYQFLGLGLLGFFFMADKFLYYGN